MSQKPDTRVAGAAAAPGAGAAEGAQVEKKSNARPEFGPSHRHGGGHPGARPVEKALNFGPSLRRMMSYLKPELGRVVVAILMTIISVGVNIALPKILGKITDTVFSGVMGKMVGQILQQNKASLQLLGYNPDTMTREQFLQLLALLKQRGGSDLPATAANMSDMLTKMMWAPGVGIDFGHLAYLTWWALGILAIGALALGTGGWILNGVIQRTVYRMREQVAGKLDRLPLKYFDSLPRGELLSRVTNDIDNISQSLQQTISQMTNALLSVIGVFAMMLTISPLLTLVPLASVPLTVLVAGLIMKRSQKRFIAMWKTTGELNGQIEEAYTGHSIVTLFSRRHEVAEVFQAKNQEMFEASFRAQFISGLIMPITMFIGNLTYVVIAVVGCLRIASGGLQLGDVQAFIQYSRQFSQPINQLASMTNLLQSGVASAERVFEVLDTTEEIDELQGELPRPVRGRVTFEHVQFAYSPDKPLITDLSLTAEPGQTVAIVGPTGAGKTTLVNLLMRFYEIQSGRITLDGVDITSVPRGALRDQLGMVLQETWLFNGTIKENIAYGQPDASDDEILAACQATYVDRFVRALPDGYETVIDEEASNISSGEKQLLTIARAFLSDPTLLILDEATSSVDTRTELLVQKAMGALRQGRTSFVIAHRLSTIRDADLILVMEHGDIVEQGNHKELLAAKGAYYDLYQTQFAAGAEDEPEREKEITRAKPAGGGGLFGGGGPGPLG